MMDNPSVMDERAKRIGHNEALYREVNERIKDINEGFSLVSETFRVVCECGNVECIDQITLSPERYEQTRQNPTHFLLKPGHEALDTERVVDRAEDGSYAIVEKAPAEARRRAEEADPRS
jgi:hypothetical protein